MENGEFSREALEGTPVWDRMVKKHGKATAEAMMGWLTADEYLDALRVQKFDGSALIDTEETVNPPTGRTRKRVAAKELASLNDKDMVAIHSFGEFLARAGKCPKMATGGD